MAINTIKEYKNNLKKLAEDISKVINNLKSKNPSYNYDILKITEAQFRTMFGDDSKINNRSNGKKTKR